MNKSKPFSELVFYVSFLFIIYVVLFAISLYKDNNTVKPVILKEKTHQKITAANKSEEVIFNTGSLKYHKVSCPWAKKCTRCIKIQKQQAIFKGGIPCKTCGG